MSIFGRLFANKSTSEDRFWQWFLSNRNRMPTILDDATQAMNEPKSQAAMKFNKLFADIEDQLHKVEKGLTFVFGNMPTGEREFIVSADGNIKLFPAVQRLVAAAPDIEGWKITAFRPGGTFDCKICIGNMSLGADDIFFEAQQVGDKVNVALHIRVDGPDFDPDAVAQAAFVVLDHALGEYMVETKVAGIHFAVLQPDQQLHLRPLKELPQTIVGMVGI